MLRLMPILGLLLAGCADIGGPPAADASPGPGARVERIFSAFNACDIEALVASYADGDLEFFTPGTPQPLTDRAQLRRYFAYLAEQPCDSPASPKHLNPQLKVRPLGAEAALVHATTTVAYAEDGKPVRFAFRFSFVLRRFEGRWQVVAQDAQSVRAGS
jgi:ketosteroid isomerase-like protein